MSSVATGKTVKVGDVICLDDALPNRYHVEEVYQYGTVLASLIVKNQVRAEFYQDSDGCGWRAAFDYYPD